MKSIRILIVSAEDVVRGPITKALLQHKLMKAGLVEFHIESAGYNAETGKKASDKTIDAVRIIANLSDHQSRNISKLNLQSYNFILCIDETGFIEVLKVVDVSSLNQEVPRVLICTGGAGIPPITGKDINKLGIFIARISGELNTLVKEFLEQSPP